MRRRRDRRGREGGVLIEGIIAVAMITVMFAGVRFFHVLHDGKSDMLREARYQAWAATRPTQCDSVSARMSRDVNVPVPLRGAAMGVEQVTATGAMAMGCNEIPHPNDDLLAVLQWATQNAEGGLLDPVVNAVTGFFDF